MTIESINRNHVTTLVQEARGSNNPVVSNLQSVEQHEAALKRFVENPHETQSAKDLYDKIACWHIPSDILEAKLSKGALEVVSLLGIIYKDVSDADKSKIDKILTTLKDAKGKESSEEKVKGDIRALLTTHQDLLLYNSGGVFIKHCESAWAYHHAGHDENTSAEMKFHKDALACNQLMKDKIQHLIDPKSSWTAMKAHAEYFKLAVVSLSKTLMNHDERAKEPDADQQQPASKNERKSPSPKRHKRSVPAANLAGPEEGSKGINIVVNGSKAKASSNVPNISNAEPQSDIKHLADLAGKLLESKLDNEQIDKNLELILALMGKNSPNGGEGIVHRLHSVTPVNVAEAPPLESRSNKATGMEQTTGMHSAPLPDTVRFMTQSQESDDEGYERHVSSGKQEFTRYAEVIRRDKVLADFTPGEASLDTVDGLPLESRGSETAGIEQNTGIQQLTRSLSQTAVVRELQESQSSEGAVHNRFITRLNVNVRQRAEKTGREQSSVDQMPGMTSVNTEDALSLESTDGKAIGLEQTAGIQQSIRSFSQSFSARLLQQQSQQPDSAVVSGNWEGPSSAAPYYAERTIRNKVFAELRPGVTSVDTVDATTLENSDGKAVGMEQNGIQPTIRPFSRRTTAHALQQSQQSGNAGALVMAELRDALEKRGGILYDNPETTNKFAVVNGGAMPRSESVPARNTERSASVSSSRWGPERQSSLGYMTAKKPKSHW